MRSKPRKEKTRNPGGKDPRREVEGIPVRVVTGEPRVEAARPDPSRSKAPVETASGRENDRTPDTHECVESRFRQLRED